MAREHNQIFSLFLFFLSWVVGWVAAATPKDDFCRRFGHQSTVIDDKLYIDGGTVNYKDFPSTGDNHDNTWLGYHDLNNLATVKGEKWPSFSIGLSKNQSIPTVTGGVLWPDAVNKRFYLYGGEQMSGFPRRSYRLLSYDILHDQWDDFGEPDVSPAPEIASFGAGVGVSETGMGYHYGGWVSQSSMSGWTGRRTMSSQFYSYAYDTGEFARRKAPDASPRAEGAMVWIPAGDTQGLLVYMGGVVGQKDGDGVAPQPLDEIFVYDAQDNSWSKQRATGEVPQHRRQFCIDVAWAPDKSSFNIYLWGGHSVYPPVTDVTSYSDVYILSLPSFKWLKAFPDHKGNATIKENGKYGSSCNMVKHMSQMLVIGGNYTDSLDGRCDDDWWGVHNLWTGTANNSGDAETWWALYDPSVNANVVPSLVYDAVGGDKHGGATATQPEGGFDPGNTLLSLLLSRRASPPERTPTRDVTHSGRGVPGPAKSSLGTGAIVGIAIGGAAGLGILVFAWWRIGRAVVRRRDERRRQDALQAEERARQQMQVQMQQRAASASILSSPQRPPRQPSFNAGSTLDTVSPHAYSPTGQWSAVERPLPAGILLHQPEPSELPAYEHDTGSTWSFKPSPPPFGHQVQ